MADFHGLCAREARLRVMHADAGGTMESTLCACSSSASFVRKDAIGGRVQLAGAYMPAMSDARLLMAEHCNGRFELLEHGHALEFHCKTASAQLIASRATLALKATASVHRVCS